MQLLIPFIILITLSIFQELRAQQLYEMPKGAQSRVSSFENMNGVKGNGGRENNGAKGHAFEQVKAGETKTLLDIKGAGVIGRIWCTASDRSPEMLRSLRIKIYWEGAMKPAVDVPLGDFFCAGLGIMTAFQSTLFADPEGRSLICYIPMPYRKGAKITVTNEGSKNLDLFFFDIDFTEISKPPSDMLYFHAFWNRAKKISLGSDFELLPTIKGRGRFIGANIGVNTDSSYGSTWWGEGEVKMFLDGDSSHPTINGTGAEDYAGSGWGLGTFANLYDGCTVADEKNGRYCFYRFHIPDPVYFQKSFRATIQEMGGGPDSLVQSLKTKGLPLIPVTTSFGWTNFFRINDYSATSYFYLDRPG